ncbi:hypothetical protein ALC57_16753 [Trachymyrmex cornetzi]|uniref:SAP domain-containing protein n=1 Tax=Trachymyrmex cornetzi TaxID=471704 RepID=A0A151IUI6_9HYME|nr:hypothetical protein ALC57_16753 [Trachymyrmex cornetzi]
MAQGGTNTIDDELSAKLAEMTVVQLKEELQQRKLKTTGLKDELISRLMAIMSFEHEHGDPERRTDVKDEDEGTHRQTRGISERDNSNSSDQASDQSSSEEDVHGKKSRKNQLLTFKDVEESLETFSGDDKVDITRWLADFEEMAVLCEWSDIQKVAYAKRLLRGSAKLFVRYERSTKTGWHPVGHGSIGHEPLTALETTKLLSPGRCDWWCPIEP